MARRPAIAPPPPAPVFLANEFELSLGAVEGEEHRGPEAPGREATRVRFRIRVEEPVLAEPARVIL